MIGCIVTPLTQPVELGSLPKKTPFSLHLFLQYVSLCVPFLSTQGLGSRETFLRACFAYNTPSPSHPISACNDVCTLCCPTTCSGCDCLWVGSWDLGKRDKFISAHMSMPFSKTEWYVFCDGRPLSKLVLMGEMIRNEMWRFKSQS
jgi:hypothetical protein